VTSPKNLILLSICQVDLVRGRVEREGDVQFLSTRELKLLAYLVARPQKPISRQELYREVWGYAAEATSRTLDVTIRRLRKKVEREHSQPEHIITVRGVGYRFEPPAELFPAERGLAEGNPTKAAQDSRLLLGREGDLGQLRAVLESGVSLLSILGPPGVGKSALAGVLSVNHPGLLVLHEPTAQQLSDAMAGRNGRTVVVASIRARRLRGEHRHVVLPLGLAPAAELLLAALASRHIPGLAARRQTLFDVAAAMGGNPLLLEAAGKHLATGAQEIGLPAALRAFDASRWLRDWLLSAETRVSRLLEATLSAMPPGARALLDCAASQPSPEFQLHEVPALCPSATADDLQDLLDHSALLRMELESGVGFLLPEPLRAYILARSAASVSVASHS